MSTDIDKLLERMSELQDRNAWPSTIELLNDFADAVQALQKQCEEWDKVASEILNAVRQKDHMRYIEAEGMGTEQAAIHAGARYTENIAYINKRMSAYRTFIGEKG